MKRHIALMATALLLCGGSYAQNTQPEKKPKAYVVADAHLDTQWNWDVQTTIKHHVWNTISQNLLLLKQYPDYIFNFEGGEICLDERILSGTIRRNEKVHPRRALAHQWCQLGCQRCSCTIYGISYP